MLSVILTCRGSQQGKFSTPTPFFRCFGCSKVSVQVRNRFVDMIGVYVEEILAFCWNISLEDHLLCDALNCERSILAVSFSICRPLLPSCRSCRRVGLCSGHMGPDLRGLETNRYRSSVFVFLYTRILRNYFQFWVKLIKDVDLMFSSNAKRWKWGSCRISQWLAWRKTLISRPNTRAMECSSAVLTHWGRGF